MYLGVQIGHNFATRYNIKLSSKKKWKKISLVCLKKYIYKIIGNVFNVFNSGLEIRKLGKYFLFLGVFIVT